ncbi:MAG: M56 family metallopeptidase [Thermoguttaceae bacterium]
MTVQITSFAGTWFLFAVVQSTVLLGLALLCSRFITRIPRKSHFLLLLGVIASFLAPSLSTYIACQNAGLLQSSLVSKGFAWSIWENGSNGSAVLLFGKTLCSGILLLGSIIFFLLLLWGVVNSRRIMFHAKPLADRESQEILLFYAKKMQHLAQPVLFTSQSIQSPTIWSWSLHPAIVLPEQLLERLSKQERDAVFLHEIAHLIRRDHWCTLLVQMLGLFLFWNPLYWIALRELQFQADVACDLLALSTDRISPEQYSAVLLKLSAKDSSRFSFQFLSRKETMMKRLNTLFDFGGIMNRLPDRMSFVWTLNVVSLTSLLIVLFAFFQEGRLDSAESQSQKKVNAEMLSDAERENIERSIERYDVNKKVDDFPDETDQSTPEGAYVVYTRIYGKPEKSGKEIADISIPTFRKGLQNATLDPISAERCQAYNESLILEVQISNDFANVIAQIQEPNQEMRYDHRIFQRLDGKWYNAGQGFVSSLADARHQMYKQIDNAAKRNILQRRAESLRHAIAAIQGGKSYTVEKRVSEFPESNNGTPENLYATFNKIIGSRDSKVIRRLKQYSKTKEEIPARELKMIKEMEEGWANVLKTATIKEVLLFGQDAIVIALLDEGRNPYDIRWMQNESGKWLNTGNGRVDSPDEMICRFAEMLKKKHHLNLTQSEKGESPSLLSVE